MTDRAEMDSSRRQLLERVRDARRRLAELGPLELRSDGDFHRISVPREDADALEGLFQSENPGVIIEIGLAYGSSALAIAEALVASDAEHPRHIIIDAYQAQFHHAGWSAIAAAGLAGICTLLEERSQFALPQLLRDGVVADAAFVDGSHIFHNVFVDLFFVGQLVHPGGLIVLDDCDKSTVAAAAKYFEENQRWQAEAIRWPTRLRAFRLPRSSTESK